MNTQINKIKEFVKEQNNQIYPIADFKLSEKITLGYLNEFGVVTNIGMYYLYENLTDDEIDTLYKKVFPSFNINFIANGTINMEIFPTNGEDDETFFSKIKNGEYIISPGKFYDYNGNIVGKCDVTDVGDDLEYSEFEKL
jgi:hypothetical protein